jgi:hypothetical protein
VTVANKRSTRAYGSAAGKLTLKRNSFYYNNKVCMIRSSYQRIAGVHAVFAVHFQTLQQRGYRIAVAGPAFGRMKPIRRNEWRSMLHRGNLQLCRGTHVPEEATSADHLQPGLKGQPRSTKHPAAEVLFHRWPFSVDFIRLRHQRQQQGLSNDLHVSGGNAVPVGFSARVNSLIKRGKIT